MNENMKLTDILQGNLEPLKSAWDNAEAADEFPTEPIPRGSYMARLIEGRLFQSPKGTAGYKMSFEIAEGEHTGRRCWSDLWLTPAALPMTKRDLAKIGVKDITQLEVPLPAVFRVKLNLAIRRDDDGNPHNRVRRFDVLGIEEPKKDAFDDQAGTGKEAKT